MFINTIYYMRLAISSKQGTRSTKPPACGLGSKAAADSRFDKYKREKPHPVRKPDIKENKALKALKEAWQSFKYFSDDDDFELEIDHNYTEATKLTRISYTPYDIQLFVISLAEFQDEEHFSLKAGIFLSALINNGRGSSYIIDVTHLSEKISYLGYLNNKTIKVVGNVDISLGEAMRTCSIVLEGNAGDFTGCDMSGGNLVIKGNAGQNIGHGMFGGIIIANGSVSNEVGQYMEGGEIHINGDLSSLGKDIKGGKIYHKGELISGKEEYSEPTK